MANTQSKEFVVALNQTINAGNQMLADGKIDGNDFSYLLPVIPAWIEGIKGLVIKSEAEVMTDEELADMFASGRQQLYSIKTEDATDIINMQQGIFSIFRLAYRKGYQAGQLSALSVTAIDDGPTADSD